MFFFLAWFIGVVCRSVVVNDVDKIFTGIINTVINVAVGGLVILISHVH